MREETARARTIVLDAPGWPGHRAGQHLDVRLTAEDGYQAQRAYSLSSPPDDPPAITVELLADGEVSAYLVEELRVGDAIEIRGPIGGHFVWEAATGRAPLLLVAGGSGLVPLMAMVRHRAAAGSSVPARLLVSARSLDDLLFAEELSELGGRDDGLEVVVTLTRTQPPGWTGHSRRVDTELLREVAWAADEGADAFVCGPTPFVEAVANGLVDLRYDPRRVRTERFGPTGGG